MLSRQAAAIGIDRDHLGCARRSGKRKAMQWHNDRQAAPNHLRAAIGRAGKIIGDDGEPGHAWASHAAMRSPTTKAGMLVLARGTTGIIEASATYRLSTPCTFPRGSTTAFGSESGPILQVPTAW